MANVSLLIGGLLFGGYLLNKDGKQPRGQTAIRQQINASEKPNGDTVYSSEETQKITDNERRMMQKRYALSTDPINTGMIPAVFNTLGVNECCNYSSYGKDGGSYITDGSSGASGVVESFENSLLPNAQQMAQAELVPADKQKIYNGPMFSGAGAEQANSAGFTELSDLNPATSPLLGSGESGGGGWGDVETDKAEERSLLGAVHGGEVSLLTGEPIDPYHNNQVPFFGGKLPVQSRNAQTMMERFTGTDQTYQPKRELEKNEMFAPVKQDIHGVPNTPDELRKERYPQSLKKNNTLPFEQVRVGHGLNQEGYGSRGVHGFHDTFRPYQRNVDELRPLNNPKLQYEGRVILGNRHSAEQRAEVGQVSKNRPDRFFVKSPERNGVARAANLEERMDPDYISALQCVNGEHDISDLSGPAKTNVNREYVGLDRADYEGRPYENEIYDNTEAVGGDGQPVRLNGLFRDTYKTSHVNQIDHNVRTNVPDMNDFGAGAFNILEEERATTGPLNESKMLNVKQQAGGEKIMSYFDTARATIADTLPNVVNDTNVKASKNDGTGYQIYNVLDRPTNKQYTSSIGYNGNPNRGQEGQGYTVNYLDGARPTIKEQVHVLDYTGIAGTGNGQEISDRTEYSNAIIRDRKEAVQPYRPPTQQKSKNLTVGAKDITINMKNEKTSTIPNQRAFSGGAGNGTGVRPVDVDVDMISLSKYRQNPPSDISWRIEPDTLKAFRSNPYTQSLHSY